VDEDAKQQRRARMTEVPKAQVDRVVGKLQTLYDGLAEEDKPVLRAILLQAADSSEVEGYSSQFGLMRGAHAPLGGVQMDLGPTESLTFVYGQIKVEYKPQQPDGT
jgi:hypothetical protein